MKRWLSILLLYLAFSLLGTQSALAIGLFRILPMTMQFDPVGQGASRSFRVTSVSDKPVAIQINMAARQITPEGKEINPEADEDFLVYPPQILLKPGEEQVVRVTWLGDNNPSKELAYRIIAEELPIELDKNQRNENSSGISVGITTVVRYVGSIYITPKNAKPKVTLVSADLQKGKDGADRLAITFENQGNAHALLNGLKLNLAPAGQNSQSAQASAIELKPEQLSGIAGENILPGNRRQFVMPWPKELPVGSIKANFTLESN